MNRLPNLLRNALIEAGIAAGIAALIVAGGQPLSASVATPVLPAFFAAGPGGTLSLRNARMTVTFVPGAVIYGTAGEFRVTYPGGRSVIPQGAKPTGGTVNTFTSADPAAWRVGQPAFLEVLFPGVWPGIDVAYKLSGDGLKSEYRLAAGADARKVRWRVDGADSLVREAGGLVARQGARSIREGAPAIFEIDRRTGNSRRIGGGFRLLGGHTAGLRVEPYDHRNRLIFDPVLGFSTYFGGSGQSQATAVVIDGNGNSVIAGFTTSLDMAPSPITFGTPLRTTAFVAKLSAAGNQLIFCTYIGGSLDNRAAAVAVDRWNNIYVAGTTSSANFPVWKAVQSARHGPQDAFIAELNPSGSALAFSTYWGGSGVEQATGIAVDRQGDIYVTGDTQSTDYPVRGGVQATNHGGFDAFVVKLAISGSVMLWSSYLGGGADDHAAGITVDFTSAVVIAGSTFSSDFPVVNAFQAHNGGSQNAFVARIDPAGSGIYFSTYAGGSGASVGLPEGASSVAVDNTASIYVAGTTASTDFPTTAGAFQRASAGGFLDAFALKLSPWGALLYSTYVGGVNADYGCALAVDAAGNAHVAGYTNSADFPSLRGVQNGVAGSYDVFVTKLNGAGTGLIYSTLLGGTQSDSAAAIAIDRYGAAVVAGQSVSSDFPTANADQSTLVGQESAIVARLPPGWTAVLFSSAGVWTIDNLRNGGSNGVSPAVETVTSFGTPGDVPILGDWSGAGRQRLGIFRNGTWFLDVNGNGVYDAGDRTFVFGRAGDIPLVGDWDGSGTAKAGLFRAGTFILDFSGLITGVATGKTSVTFPFGNAGDIPVVGDWNGFGTSKVGVFRNGEWLLDTNGSHTINGLIRALGHAGDLPLTGDWDGSGLTKAGVYRNGLFMLDYNGNWNLDAYGDVTLPFGPPTPYAMTQY